MILKKTFDIYYYKKKKKTITMLYDLKKKK